jgi:hypothetical protein
MRPGLKRQLEEHATAKDHGFPEHMALYTIVDVA